MALATSTALLAALAATVVMAALHASIPLIRRETSSLSESLVASVGGGIAAAYVFLHLLPEIAAGNERVSEALGDTFTGTPLADLLLFAVALGGFLVLYGLDHVAERATHRSTAVFAVHLGVFAVYNGVIAYTLSLQFRTGVDFAVLFTLAMALHFLLTDRHLDEHYEERFRGVGRPVLMAALFTGWFLSWVFAPTSTVVVSVLIAALGGFVIFNVFNDELPSERRTRYPAFLAGSAAYTALLVWATAAGG